MLPNPDPSKLDIRCGRLTVIAPDGERHTLEGPGAGPEATLRISDPKILRRMFVIPDLYMGEGYMDGAVTIEEGTLYDALDFFATNVIAPAVRALGTAESKSEAPSNPVGRSQENVAHHYDLVPALFEMFLDEDLNYSCAFFDGDNDSLEQAQQNKLRRIADKLALEPGMRVLDIGSGFGSMALFLARTQPDVEVVGVTLSKEQLQRAKTRAEDLGVTDRVRFELRDYRDVEGAFDRIVSIGMYEHVGRGHAPEFFAKVDSLLTGQGVALLHSIGRMAPPGSSVGWITKYIFPGGYTPSLSETLGHIERAGLWVTDVEILRLHYALTLREWNRRFQANRQAVAGMYDERFCRMWEYYLQICEVAFRRLNWMVFQIQIAKKVDTLPLSRDYLYRAG